MIWLVGLLLGMLGGYLGYMGILTGAYTMLITGSLLLIGDVMVKIIKKKRTKKKNDLEQAYAVAKEQRKKKEIEKEVPQEKEADVPEEPVKEINPVYKNRSKFDIKYWSDKIKDKFFPHRTVQVNMELLNGMHHTFLKLEADSGFKYRGKKFLFDNSLKYYNLSSKLWCYDYHEGFTLPIRRVVPVNDIRTGMEVSQISEVEYATNPATLEQFVVSKIAEGIMKGQAIDEAIRRMITIGMITGAAAVIHLVLFMYKTGMFNQVSGTLGLG